MRILTMMLTLALAGAFGSAYAQAYRWVDKNGKTRYGDFPPAGAKATLLKPPPGGVTPAPSEPGTAVQGEKTESLPPVSPEQAYRERQMKAKEAQEKADKQKAAADLKKQSCASAQESLRNLESGRRISSVNAKGESVYLDDAQIQTRLELARKVSAEACN